MDFDIFKGKWKQMKGDLKAKWGQITDDEWTEINGDRDKLIGRLQERYGRAKDDVRTEVDDFFRNIDLTRRDRTGVDDISGEERTPKPGRDRKVS